MVGGSALPGALLVLAVAAVGCQAQQARTGVAEPRAPLLGPGIAAWRLETPPPDSALTSAVALRHGLASALVPGAGQFLQGRRRWIVFLTAEAAAWAFHLDARQDARRLRTGYRDLAWSVARNAPEPRVDGNFEYYERMARWLRSGSFDSEPGSPELEPERDPSTYNGAQWELAAAIHLEGDVHAAPGRPGYDAALAFYRERAYPEPFLWDWSDVDDQQARFGDLIERSDDRFRTASVALVLVAANHLLAAVDAFAAARLSPTTAGPSLGLAPGPGPASNPYVVLRLPWSGGFR
jgi:hypothetical protein